MRINGQGLGYANKTICRKTLENGAGADCHLRRDAASALGGNDLGLNGDINNCAGNNVVIRNTLLRVFILRVFIARTKYGRYVYVK